MTNTHSNSASHQLSLATDTFPSLTKSPTDKPTNSMNTDNNDHPHCSTKAVLMTNTHNNSASHQSSLTTDNFPSLIKSPTDKSTNTMNTDNNDPRCSTKAILMTKYP